MIAFGAALMSGCSKEDPMVDPQIQNDEMSTLTKTSVFHWTCQHCRFTLNSSWQNSCSRCFKEYDPTYGHLVITFYDMIKAMVKVDYTISGTGAFPSDASVGNRIQLPGRLFLEYAPTWYETAAAKKYYTDITKILIYTSNPDYAEGVDYAWYHTVRILYPQKTNLGMAQRAYDKFIIGEGTNLKGQKGTGIKAGSKAAVNAFGTCK